MNELLKSFEFRMRQEVHPFTVGDEVSTTVKKSSFLGKSKSVAKNSSAPAVATSPEKEKEDDVVDDEDDLNKVEVEHVPTLDPLYSSWPPPPPVPLDMESLPDYLRPEWPTEEDCDSEEAAAMRWDAFPTAFMSPENKGFE